MRWLLAAVGAIWALLAPHGVRTASFLFLDAEIPHRLDFLTLF